MSTKQLYEKTSEGMKEVNPLVTIEDIYSKLSDTPLEALVSLFNHVKCEWKGSVTDTRRTVPLFLRRSGLFITYNNGTKYVTEFFSGGTNQITTEGWIKNSNWTPVPDEDYISAGVKPGVGSIGYEQLNDNLKQLFREKVNVTNYPDDEDITSVDNMLKFKDRESDVTNFQSKGYVVLRKNLRLINGTIKNILTQDMINNANVIYEIRYDYDLNKATINLPQNCILRFCGGSLNNGELIGDNSIIDAYPIKIFGKDLDVLGTFTNSMNYAEWFDLDYEKTLLSFYGIDFIGNYLISKKISVDSGTHRIYLKFHPQSKITVDSTFIDDYLFDIKNSDLADTATRSDHNAISGQGEIDLSERCGLISFTASNKISNLVAKGTDFFNLSNVYHAGKSINNTSPTYNSDTVVNTAIIKVSSESKFTNVELHASRNTLANKPDCGILLQGSDHKLNRVTIVISTIGIYGIQGNTFVQDCHIWGAPQIAFYITGNHTINNTYGDWAVCSFYFKNNWILVNITNHFIIGSSNQNLPWYQGKNMSIIKAKNPDMLSGQVSYFHGNASKAKLCVNDNNEEVESNIRFQYIPNTNDDFNNLQLTQVLYNPDFTKDEFYIAIESNGFYSSNLTIDLVLDSCVFDKFIYSRLTGSGDYYCLAHINKNRYRCAGMFNMTAHINKEQNKIIIKAKSKYTKVCINTIPNVKVKSYNIAKDVYDSYVNDTNNFVNLPCIPLESNFSNLPEISKNINIPCYINDINNYCSIHYPDKKINSIIPNIINTNSTDMFNIGFVAQKDGKIIIWNGTTWVNSDGYSNNYLRKGTTTNRPSLTSKDEGFEYYDTTLKKKILWNGTVWVNLDGTELAQ